MKQTTERQKLHQRRRAWSELKRRRKLRKRSSKPIPRVRAFSTYAYDPSVLRIKVPSHLDLDGNRYAMIKLLRDLRGALFRSKTIQVFLDFSGLQFITSEAGLVLLAEISRSLQFKNNRVLRGNNPKAPVPAQMLSDMGYYDFFKLLRPPTPASSRISLKAISNHLTDGEVVDQLITVFENQLSFHGIGRKKLYEALIECMQNVRHHAYPRWAIQVPTLDKQWWMMGFSDPATSEISFAFVDLGVGIPRTLFIRWRNLLAKAGFVFQQSELILSAIDAHQSRLKDVRRGNGLTVLREMFNTSPEGVFRIMSDKAHIKIRRNSAEIVAEDEVVPFDGTLISWVLYSSKKPELYAEE